MNLRPRQLKAVDDIIRAFESGYKAPTLVAPTGFGKTVLSAHIVSLLTSMNKRVWFMAHLTEILKSTCAALDSECIEYGIIKSGVTPNFEARVQIVSVKTAALADLDKYEKPDLLIIDEAHLAVAETYRIVMDQLDNPPLLLLTATPCRLDGRGLNEISDVIIPTCSTQDLIDEKLLVDIEYYTPQVKSDKLTGSIIKNYKKYAANRPTIVFCSSVQHAKDMARKFNMEGIKSMAIHSDTIPEVRDAALKQLEAGTLDVVFNYELWVAGVDIPCVSCIIFLCKTESLTKYLQAIGRGLRTHKDKTNTVILDHANLLEKHGYPTISRIWSLNGNAKVDRTDAKTSEFRIKYCKNCYAINKASATFCRCGVEFGKKDRSYNYKMEECDLVQTKANGSDQSPSAVAKKPPSIAALMRIAKLKGYKPGWAHHVYNSKLQKYLESTK